MMQIQATFWAKWELISKSEDEDVIEEIRSLYYAGYYKEEEEW